MSFERAAQGTETPYTGIQQCRRVVTETRRAAAVLRPDMSSCRPVMNRRAQGTQ